MISMQQAAERTEQPAEFAPDDVSVPQVEESDSSGLLWSAPIVEAICGNRSAAQVLLYLEAYGTGYGKGIADTYGVAVSAVQRQLKRLEARGVLVSRMVGGSRVFEFETRNPTVRQLRELLRTELATLPEATTRAFYRERRRPRRTGKP